jgi:hypothetical protein
VTQVLVEKLVHGDGASDDVGELVAIECGLDRGEGDVRLFTSLDSHINRPSTKPPTVFLESLDEEGEWTAWGEFETRPGEIVGKLLALPRAPFSMRLRWACEPPERSLHWALRAWV